MWISPAKYLRALLVVGLVVCGSECIAAQGEGGPGRDRGPAGGRGPGERMMGGVFPGLGGAVELLRKEYGDFGSGYITDPKTLDFLREWRRSHDEYPPIVRVSWKTIREIEQEIGQSRLGP